MQTREPASLRIVALTMIAATLFVPGAAIAAMKSDLVSSARRAGDLAFGDFDGDGFEDVVVATTGVDVFRFSANGRNRLELIPSPPRDSSGFVLAVADFNADAYADLVVGNTQSGLDLFFGTPHGLQRHADIEVAVLGNDTIHAVSATDLDYDGVTDLLVGTAGYNLLVRGSTHGFQPSELAFNDTGRLDSSAFLVFDADGDGDRDVLIANDGGDDLYLGNAAGSFSLDSRREKPRTEDPTDFFVADDVNRDGLIDVIAGSERVYVRAATDLFATAIAIAQTYYEATPAVTGPSLFLVACVLLIFTVFRLRRRVDG